MKTGSITTTATLLSEVFPGLTIARSDYLDWLYQESPFGQVVEANCDDEHGRVGHYALTPILLTRDGVDHAGGLSLNTAVHERARGGGIFTKLASEAIADAQAQGAKAIVGVANANSTPGFLRHLEFELVRPLPASVLVPTPGSRDGINSAWLDPAAFGAADLVASSEGLLNVPVVGEARRWTAGTLRWRLARPGSRYALHWGRDLLAVSCRDIRHGVHVAILLKVFAAAPLSARRSRAIVRAACRLHRAPLALHIGVSDLAAFSGLALPSPLRESPLNLIYRSLEEPRRPSAIVRFELLDFDAY